MTDGVHHRHEPVSDAPVCSAHVAPHARTGDAMPALNIDPDLPAAPYVRADPRLSYVEPGHH